jgi:uncharacterized membrane protein
MNNDETIALALGAISALLLLPAVRYSVLEFVGNPYGAVAGLLLILYVLVNRYAMTALVVTAVFIYLLHQQVRYHSSVERQVYLDTIADDSRFVSANSVDIQIANKTFMRDSPNMLNPPEPTPPLLTYPPSQETLISMSG